MKLRVEKHFNCEEDTYKCSIIFQIIGVEPNPAEEIITVTGSSWADVIQQVNYHIRKKKTEIDKMHRRCRALATEPKSKEETYEIAPGIQFKIQEIYQYFSFAPEKSHQCHLRILLPAKDGEILKELQSNKDFLAGRFLVGNWGYDEGEYRSERGWIEGSNWEEVTEKVDRFIKNTINLLQEIYRRNTTPEDTVEEYEIGNGILK